MVGLSASLAAHFRNGHFTSLRKQFRQVALVPRIEVLNQHEGHAGILGQAAEQFRECLQPAGRSAYADNPGEGIVLAAYLSGRLHDSHVGNRLLCQMPPLPFWETASDRTAVTRLWSSPARP